MNNKKQLRKYLKDVLESIPEVDDSRELAIYGAGNTSALYETTYKAEGLKPLYFIDNAPKKHGTIFQGRPVIDLAEAQEKCRGFLILVSSGNYSVCEDIVKSLRENPVEGALCMTADEYVFRRHIPEILAVFDWLSDELSRETYVNMLLARILREKQRYELTVPNQYFGVPEFTFRNAGEVFVDCGAYVGDSIEQYLMGKAGTFGKIFAFEPDKRNFAAMEARTKRLMREWAIGPERICLVNAGVGEKSASLALRNANRDTASLGAKFSADQSLMGGGQTVPVVALDEYFADQRISFLKADIESFEYPMLLGAGNLLKRDVPKIAICIYHNPSDLFRIACELKRLVPDYHLAVRQHTCELCDTVLYAWR